MDLNHQLYLVVATDLQLRATQSFQNRYEKLRISASALRSRMDPEAFILNDRNHSRNMEIFRIPPDANDSFAAEFFSEALGLDLKPGDISFQWD